MKNVYYPGCSLTGTAEPYQKSIDVVLDKLGVVMEELEDWNCCGASACMNVNPSLSYGLAGRNLALAEKQGANLVTPCTGCFNIEGKANRLIREDQRVRDEVTTALSAADLSYSGSVEVRHILQVFIDDVGLDRVRETVTSPLTGLKVAPYYGCQLTRPEDGIDDAENPTMLDDLLGALGSDVVDFPMKTRCCGAMLAGTQPEFATELQYALLASAQSSGAQCIATICPLCQVNLEFFQGRVNKAYGTNFKMPIVFFTQLMGQAMGGSEKELGMDQMLVSTREMAVAGTVGGLHA